jgi:hypothetical protein
MDMTSEAQQRKKRINLLYPVACYRVKQGSFRTGLFPLIPCCLQQGGSSAVCNLAYRKSITKPTFQEEQYWLQKTE